MLSDAEKKKYQAKIRYPGSELPIDFKRVIGVKVQERRKQTPLSQEDVAEIMKVSAKTISRLERGDFKTVPYEMLNGLADLYECTLTDFLPRELAHQNNPLARMDDAVLQSVLTVLNGEQARRQTA